MKVRRAGSSGSMQAKTTSSLVPGQMVHGRVIAKLTPGLFRIGAAGQVFLAESDLPLQQGQKLKARVELGNTKVFLRIFEDAGHATPSFTEEPDAGEIERILTGLGHQPEEVDVIEFQERVSRYRKHGSFLGVEPSDIWILAILWTRGIRGGADAFALLSYYLRQATFLLSASPVPADLADIFINSDTSTVPKRSTASSSSDDVKDFSWEGDEIYPIARRREALELLNRNAENWGYFRHTEITGDGSCALEFKDGIRTSGRWSDNPTLSRFLFETVVAQGRITARLHWLKTEGSEDIDEPTRFINLWRESINRTEYEIEKFDIIEVTDIEQLRFLFWRRWNPERFQDLTA